MSLLTGPVKRSVMARIAGLADAGGPIDGVQVARFMPQYPERWCVYGGQARFVREPVTAEHGVLYRDTILYDVRIRVVELGEDLDAAEAIAENIAAAVATAVVAEPRLTGPGGQIGVTSGDEDPVVVAAMPEPSIIVNLGLVVTVVVNARP